jgi:hypothetical protein
MRHFRLFAPATPALVLLAAAIVWSTDHDVGVNAIEADGRAEVVLTRGLEDALSTIYGVAEKEIPLCLFGTRNEDGTRLKRAAFPDQLSTTDSTVTFDGTSCEAHPDFLGYVHNHDPSGSLCEPTPLDKVRFALNSDSKVELIACTRETGVTYHAFGL